MIIPLPFPCTRPGETASGVSWLPEEGEQVHTAVVDPVLVLEVVLKQAFSTPMGAQASHKRFLEAIRSGRVEGFSEEQAEAVAARRPAGPYVSLRIYYSGDTEFGFFWAGDGSYDGWDAGGPLPESSADV